MGTPEFAVPSLKALIESGDEVVALVAQPDKPSGRGRKLAPPPTKLLAQEHGIPVLQPSSIRTDEFLLKLKKLNPDLICVVAYGKILPKAVLDLPRFGCINVHASLLPKYRGAAPINWAIVRGEKITGVTTMLMDEAMDTGDVLLKRETVIDEEDNGETLSRKMSELGAELLIATVGLLKRGELNPRKQDDSQASYAPILKKDDGRIDWSKPALEIKNLVRGMLPWPGAFTTLSGNLLKIYSAQLSEGMGRPGEVIKSGPGILRVSTGSGAIDILELQVAGGKRLDSKAFLAGRKIPPGTLLGE